MSQVVESLLPFAVISLTPIATAPPSESRQKLLFSIVAVAGGLPSEVHLYQSLALEAVFDCLK